MPVCLLVITMLDLCLWLCSPSEHGLEWQQRSPCLPQSEAQSRPTTMRMMLLTRLHGKQRKLLQTGTDLHGCRGHTGQSWNGEARERGGIGNGSGHRATRSRNQGQRSRLTGGQRGNGESYRAIGTNWRGCQRAESCVRTNKGGSGRKSVGDGQVGLWCRKPICCDNGVGDVCTG